MKSLIIVSAPRSMSSFIYGRAVCLLTGELQALPSEPWHDGDPLNHIGTEFPKLSHKHAQRTLRHYDKYAYVLDKYKEDYVIKTVAQPVIVAEYLNQNPDAYNVLYLRRSFADVVYALHMRNWYWPLRILGLYENNSRHCNLRNLCRAVLAIHYQGLGLIENKTLLSYENLLWNDGLLASKLRSMGYDLVESERHTKDFESIRDDRLSRRGLPLYKEIEDTLKELMESTHENLL